MTIDGKMKQEVRLKADISLTINAHHTEQDIREILMRGIYNAFPNNPLQVNELMFAEERDIYWDAHQVKWTNITEEYKEKNESK